jgi:diphthine-ammonia ligase
LVFLQTYYYCRKKVETVIHSDNSFASVAFLRIKDAVLESKTAKPLSASVPPLLADQYKAVRDAILSSHDESRMAELPLVDQQGLIFNHSTMATSSLQRSNWVTVSNVQAHGFPSVSNITFEEEVIKCFQILTGRFFSFMHNF